MSFKSNLKLDAPIFNEQERKRAFSSVVSRSAREFAESTRRKMVESQPAGKVDRYETGAGRGFSRGFRRSRRGQRPAIESGTLINAIESRRINELSSVVEIADKINPNNGESARDYAEKLQFRLDRKIMVSEDIAEASQDFTKRLQEKLLDLL